MTNLLKAGVFKLGDKLVKRMGYGAMQLAGPHVFGPPRDHQEALNVLRAAIAAGVDHIDTSDFYGPHVTNRLIREALYPYSQDLVIVTKVGVRRGKDGSWHPAQSPEELVSAVHENLKNLDLEVIDVVNLRVMGNGNQGPTEGSIEGRFAALADLQRRGLIRHLGLSNVTAAQVAEAQTIAPIVCVQNQYNIAQRSDDAMIDLLFQQGIAYVPFFPLGGFSLIQSAALEAAAVKVGAPARQVALAWLLARASNVLLIPGTAKVNHLQENLAATEISLSAELMEELEATGKTF